MEPIKINNNKALIIAHRGLSGIEVENTCASFSLAASKSYFGIETDVHVTKDNKFIICHDDSTKRLSGIDKIIENSTYDEIRSLPIYNKEGKYDDNLFFPNLYEYISICKNNNKTCVLEIKNIMKKEHLKNIIKIIQDNNYLDQMIFISFNKENILSLKEIHPDGHYQFLSGIEDDSIKDDVLDFAITNKVNVDVYYKNLNDYFINKCKENNIKINVFTVDDKDAAEALIEKGIDYITSNILE